MFLTISRVSALLLFSSLVLTWRASAHGPGGHRERPEEEILHSTESSESGKSFKSAHEHSSRWWGASLDAGWESRHIHYGVNETGNSGAYTTELSLWIKDLTVSVWSGFGTGSEYQEWNFTVAYQVDLGSVFFIPGYNFRYTPGIVEQGEGEEEHGEEGGELHDEEGHDGHEEHGGHSHAHETYGNELFFVLGTTKIPYVTPNIVFVWDLNNTPGAFMELRLDGDIPVWKDILSVQPYAFLGLNFGYNTQDYYGWNNFQFGIEASWKINKTVRVFGGVNYSVALPALDEIGQGNEVWANAGVSLAY
jgi:hypothetical protein